MITKTLVILALVALLQVRAADRSPIAKDDCFALQDCNSTKYASYDWTRGVIKSTEDQHFDKEFLLCQYPRYLCGYVPGRISNGEYYVNGNKGVHLSQGVDLGSMDVNEFNATLYKFSGLKPLALDAIVTKVKLYFKVQKTRAARLLMDTPVILTDDEETTIFDSFSRKNVQSMEKEYNEEKEKTAPMFAELPFGVRTAMSSFAWQFGSIKAKSADLWKSLLKNDMVGVARAYDQGKFDDAIKRKREKQIILAAGQKCSKSVDVAFLVDESSSVKAEGFQQAKSFLNQFVQAQESIGPQATRVAVTTYAKDPRTIVALNSNDGKVEILNKINAMVHHSGGTNTGKALKALLDTLESQRRTTESISMALIVITDGSSGDPAIVVEQSKRAKSLGIMTIAVGVGQNLNEGELTIIADNDMDRKFKIDNYAALDKFIQALSASSCNLRLQPKLGQELSGTISSPIEPFYYEVLFNYSQNINFTLNVTNGSQDGVQMYFSFSDKYPDNLSYDKKHSGRSGSTLKEYTLMAPEQLDLDASPMNATVYLAVSGEANLTYTILIDECDPVNCKPGSNDLGGDEESKGGSGSLWVLWVFLSLTVAGGIGYFFFMRYKQRLAYEASATQNASPYSAYT